MTRERESLFHALRQKAQTDLQLGHGYYSHADILALLDVCQAAAEYVDELDMSGMAEDDDLCAKLKVIGV